MPEYLNRLTRIKNRIIGGEIPGGIAARIRDEVLQSISDYPTRKMIQNSTSDTRISEFSITDQSTREKRKTPLSNFYPVSVAHNGKTYPNVEAAFQAAKFPRLDNIPEAALKRVTSVLEKEGLSYSRENIADLFTDATIDPAIQPKIAKKVAGILGDREYNLLRDDWRTVNLEIMMDLLVQKFRHPEMLKYLLGTGNKFLFEGNDWKDDFYGVVMENGVLVDGKNILGRALMNIREKLDSGELPRQRRFVIPGMRR